MRQRALVGVGVAAVEIERDERVRDARQDVGDVGARGLRLLPRRLRLGARRLGAREQLLPLLFGAHAVGDVLEDAEECTPCDGPAIGTARTSTERTSPFSCTKRCTGVA